jgi:murein L,D-transpeptidase YcbB/YkuD
MVSAAPACTALLEEASDRWPRRRTTSDGILSSDQHRLQNPRSDHDYGNAVDLSHDPDSGCDAHAEVRRMVARGDTRIKNAISNRQIWSRAYADRGWRPYTGSNSHTNHAHISIYAGSRNDTRRWLTPAPPPPPAHSHPTPLLKRGMNDEQLAGTPIADLQGHLRAWLRFRGQPEPTRDGDFGPATEHCVKVFQNAYHLTADGIAGPRTWSLLHEHSNGKIA